MEYFFVLSHHAVFFIWIEGLMLSQLLEISPKFCVYGSVGITVIKEVFTEKLTDTNKRDPVWEMSYRK